MKSITDKLLNANNNLMNEIIGTLATASIPTTNEISEFLSEPFSDCGFVRPQPAELNRVLTFRKLISQLIDIQKELGDTIDDMVADQYMGIK
jgi:hypothetical protein